MRDVEYLAHLTQKELQEIKEGDIVSCAPKTDRFGYPYYIFFKVQEAVRSELGDIYAFRGTPFCPGKDVRHGEMTINVEDLRPFTAAYETITNEYEMYANYYSRLLKEVKDMNKEGQEIEECQNQ